MRVDRQFPSVLVLLVLGALALIFGCDDGDSGVVASPSADGIESPSVSPSPTRHLTSLDLPVRVAVTLPIFEDFARVAAGDHGEVFSLVPEGEDPQTYELTQSDLDRLSGVFFFFVNGLGLDSHLQEQIEANRDERSFVIPFAPNVRSPTESGLTAEQAMDEAHLWMDPDLAAIYVAIVADEFVIYDEVNRNYYDERYLAERMSLGALATELAAEIAAAVPEEQRRLVTYSDALTHLARRFDIEIVATARPISDSETEDEIIDRLVQVVENEDIPGVVAEFGHDDSILQAVASRTGIPVCTVHTDVADGTLKDYEALMRANVAEVIRCLGG